VGIGGCRHLQLDVRCLEYAWPDGKSTRLSACSVTCECGKAWIVGLTREQRRRVRSLSPGDRRSPYEIAPEVLREL
jgi:hypothetical protein